MTTTSTTAGTTGPAFDLDRIRASMKAMEAVMANEPIRRWMTEQGASPDNGWLLILPVTMCEEVGPFPPRYVRFSAHTPAPLLVRDVFGIAAWLAPTI